MSNPVIYNSINNSESNNYLSDEEVQLDDQEKARQDNIIRNFKSSTPSNKRQPPPPPNKSQARVRPLKKGRVSLFQTSEVSNKISSFGFFGKENNSTSSIQESKIRDNQSNFLANQSLASNSYMGFTLENFTNPSVINDQKLVFLSGDGEYKNAYNYPGNPNKIALIYKTDKHNKSAKEVYNNHKNSVDQYRQIKSKFGEDACVRFINEDSIMQDCYFDAENIPSSLHDVLSPLKGKLLDDIEQLKYPQTLDANQTQAVAILHQIKSFYDRSLYYEINTDIHLGNFRVKTNDRGENKIVLTDFREVIDEKDLVINKKKELKNLKKDLKDLFSEKFIDCFFEDTIEKINKESIEIEEDDWDFSNDFLNTNLSRRSLFDN